MIRATFPETETGHPRGAAPVGQLSELPALERVAIGLDRAWCDGGEGRALIAREIARVLPPAEVFAAVEEFDDLMRTMIAGQRRRIMRHGLECPCFCGDEAAFAQMIAAAAMRDRDDAMLFAATLVSGPAAFRLVAIAEALGQVFLRLARSAGPAAPHAGCGATRH
ncbi:hypothetical protein [Palleronia sp. LCG004]|uniref:hypothetical protein n=1 Tax=Palleronia sp. LCG004 TaxID=3079304 RepID=UPI00294229A3|nr:hypothetical protein [Palleronia sp. LCG004]WOI56639.1 hypothetical protein RVY76_02225 [Palleronia sp. LCG004]